MEHSSEHIHPAPILVAPAVQRPYAPADMRFTLQALSAATVTDGGTQTVMPAGSFPVSETAVQTSETHETSGLSAAAADMQRPAERDLQPDASQASLHPAEAPAATGGRTEYRAAEFTQAADVGSSDNPPRATVRESGGQSADDTAPACASWKIDEAYFATISAEAAVQGDVLLPYTMPQNEYMYGCTITAAAMLLGYYDKYGYLGYDLSNLIDGDIDIYSRGTDGNIYDMDAFDTVLGSFTASREYVSRFYNKTPMEEFEYAFVDGGTEYDTSLWNCLADYVGTGQYWRNMGDLATVHYCDITLAGVENSKQNFTVTSGDISRTLPIRYNDLQYGLALYVRSRGYDLDGQATRHRTISASGSSFTFQDFMAEIDAGRGVLISLSAGQSGHSVIAYGYNASTQEIIFDDTYSADCRMTWTGTYRFSGADFSLSGATTIVFKTDGLSRLQPETCRKLSAFSESGSLRFGLGNHSELAFTGIDGITSGYIAGIGGLTTEDFTFVDEPARVCYLQHDKITDAEKSDRNSVDDLWCGPMTETNMLELTGTLNRCGYQSGDQMAAEAIAEEIDKTAIRPREYVFHKLDTSWKISWGSFDRTGAKNTWLQQADTQLRSGQYIGWFQVQWGTPDNVTGNHAMTLWGFTYDTRYQPDDPRYYSGVILTDSDDSKHNFNDAANAPNRLKVERIVWDSTIQNYRFRNGAGFLENVWTIKKLTPTSGADLTWYHPNDWSDCVTITNSATESNDCTTLQAGQQLYANIAIQNQGTADAGTFYISLYLDDAFWEKLQVDALSANALAALQHYSLGTLAAGTHTLKMVIDTDDDITEPYEANNTFTKTFTVFEAGTLKITSGHDVILRDGQNLTGAYLSSGVGLDARYSGCKITGNTLDGLTHTVATGEIFSANTLVNSAWATVSSGAVVTQNRLSAGGTEDVFSGGITSSAVILSGGKILLAGGIAYDTVVSSGGRLAVRSYGDDLSTASRAQIYSGGSMDVYDSSVAKDTVIHQGGYVRVRDYGSALGTIIESGASMYVHSSSGYAENTVISGFGRVYDGGLMSNTSIMSGGSFHLWRGGTLKDVEVQYGGLLDLRESAPILAGDVRVAGQLKASYNQNVNAANAKITIELAQRKTADTYSIVNLDYLGQTSITVAAAADQAEGTYRLASGASAFDDAIAISVNGKNASSALALNQTISFKGFDFTLYRSQYNLFLTVAHNQYWGWTGPECPEVDADITAPTNRDVTVTATFSDDAVTRQYSLDNQTWLPYTNAIVFHDNGSVWFRAFDCDGAQSPIAQYTVGNIDRIAPDKPTVTVSSTAIINKDVTVKASFSSDSVTRLYSLDAATWNNYTAPVVMTQNGTVWFKGRDAAGNDSEIASCVVANIDKTPPAKPAVSADITSTTTQPVTVTAVFSADTVIAQYSRDGKTWNTYPAAGITLKSNGTLLFRGFDTAQNASEIASYTVENIIVVAPDKPTVSADITAPTQQNVTVSASFSANTAVRQYSRDGTNWSTYSSPVVMSANGTVYFRGLNESQQASEIAAYTVSNIDRTAPVIKLAGNNSAACVKSTLAASTEAGLKIYFNTISESYAGVWTEYTGTLTIKTNGTYYFKATDAAGNTGTASMRFQNINSTVPVITLAADTTTPLKSSRLTATTEAGLKITYNTVSASYTGAWKEYTGAFDVTANGTYYFKTINNVGTVGTASISFTNIDSTAPVITLQADTTTPLQSSVLTAATEDGIKLYYNTNYAGYTGTWAEYTGQIEVKANLTYYFKATDAAGNTGTAAIQFKNIDNVPPVITLTGDTATPLAKSSVTAVTEAGLKIYYNDISADSQGQWTEYTGAIDVLKNGSFFFKATDKAGNTGTAAIRFTNIDTEPPVITLTADTTTPLQQTSLAAATEPGVAIYYNTVSDSYSGRWTEYLRPITVTENAVYYFKATDTVGNIGTASIQFENIDRTPPVITLTGDTTSPLQKSLLTATTEPGIALFYNTVAATYAGQWLQYTDHIEITENAAFFFKATDAAGNTGTAAIQFNNIDTEPPVITLQGDTTSPLNKAAITATIAENLDILYSTDNQNWLKYTAPVDVTANGVWYFKATDDAGNTGYNSIQFYNIDTVPPVIQLAGDTATPTRSTTLAATTEPGITLAYNTVSQDYAGRWLVYTKTISVTDNASYFFKATDAAGNTGYAEITFDNIDNTPPEAPAATADHTTPTNQDVNVSAAFPDDATLREFSLDGRNWNPYTDAIVMHDNGKVYFRATDSVGNISDITTYTVDVIDRTPPGAPTAKQDIVGPTNKSVTVTPTFSKDTAIGQFSLDGQEWQTCDGPVVMRDNGTVWFRGLDAAGNASEAICHTVANIDLSVPVITLTGNTTRPAQSARFTATTDTGRQIFYNTVSADYTGPWTLYEGPINVTANGTYYFMTTNSVGTNGYASMTFQNIDLVPPDAPTPIPSTTEPTNTSVIVAADFTDDSTLREFSFDRRTWQIYKNGVEMTDNGIVYFRATDEAGNTSDIASYRVTNIDRIAPDAPTATADITAWTSRNVTVTAVFSDDSVLREYSLDGTHWRPYAEGIVFTENGAVRFRGTDAAGNTSAETRFDVANITDDDNWNDLKSAGPDGMVNFLGVVGETAPLDYENEIGKDDPIDYMAFTLESAASLVFDALAQNAAKLSIYSLNAKTDKKGLTTYSLKQLQATNLKPAAQTATKPLLLNAGTYYIGIANAKKDAPDAEYSITLGDNTQFFTRGDNSDDWTSVKTDGTDGLTGETVVLSASGQSIIDGGWVGYGDAVDYQAFTLESAAQLFFNLAATDAAAFSINALTEKTSKGITKYTLKNLQTTAVKAGKAVTTKALLLTAGTYYIGITSSNASKGGSADYTVELADNAVFFTKGDTSDDWTDVKTAGTDGLPGAPVIVSSSGQAVIDGGWVGYGDAVDYQAITLKSAARLVFNLSSSDAAVFTINTLTEKTGRGITTYTLKSLQSTAVKTGKTVTTKALLLTAGTYYIGVSSSNAKKGGSADYAVTVADSSAFFTQGDNSDDTWQAALRQKAQDIGDDLAGWVGFGDATDFFKISLDRSGFLTLQCDDATAAAVKSKALKLTCLDVNGKSVALGAISNGRLTSKKAMTAGTYAIGVQNAKPTTFDTDYKITLGMLA